MERRSGLKVKRKKRNIGGLNDFKQQEKRNEVKLVEEHMFKEKTWESGASMHSPGQNPRSRTVMAFGEHFC